MDLNTIIIGIVIITLVTVPLVYIQMSQKKKKKKAKNEFLSRAKTENVHVSEIDFWGTYYALAIDETTSQLVYSKKTDSDSKWLTANLNEVTDCYIHKTEHSLKNKGSNKTEIDRLDLVLRTKGKSDYVLEFYNVDINIEMAGETLLLEKWRQIIKKHLNTTKAAA
ncbi:hypothetical protein ACW5R3_06930 [Bizionia sp. KMM 8389]